MKNALSWFLIGFLSYAVFMPVVMLVIPQSAADAYIKVYSSYIEMLATAFGLSS